VHPVRAPARPQRRKISHPRFRASLDPARNAEEMERFGTRSS